MKSIFLVCLLMIPSMSAQQPTPAPQAANGVQVNGKNVPQMPKLTEKDLEEMFEVLGQLDEKELESLAKIGEDFIKEAEASGQDPYELLGFPEGFADDMKNALQEAPQEPEAPTEPQPKVPETPQEKADAPEPKIEKETISRAQVVLKNSADAISTVRQRAEVDRRARDHLMPLRHLLDDIVYFALTLRQEHLVKYLVNPEFEALYKAYATLAQQLTHLEPYIIFPEQKIEKESPYRTLGLVKDALWDDVARAYQRLIIEKDPQTLKRTWQKEGIKGNELTQKVQQAQKEYDRIVEAYQAIVKEQRAYQALEQFIEAIVNTERTKKLLEGSKNVLAKYEPEALKKKEQQEKLEAQARKEQEEAIKRRPPYTPMVFDPLPYFNGGGLGLDNGDTYLTTTPTPPEPTPDVPFEQPLSDQGDQLQPTPPSENGEKPTTPDKKKESDAKGKEDKKEEPKKDTPRLDPAINKKLENVDKEINNLISLIQDGSETGLVPPAKNLFKQFTNYVQQGIDPNNAEEKKRAKDINTMLAEMTKKINLIKRELRAPDLTRSARESLRKETHTKLIDLEKDYLKKFLPELMQLRVKNDTFYHGQQEITLDPTKQYLHTGQEPTGLSQAVKGIVTTPDNYLKAFMDAYKALTEEVKKTDKSPH